MNATRTTAEPMTSRDEAWKYTPVKEILARVRTAANATGVVGDGLSRSTIDALAGNLFGPRVVFVNGFFASDLSDIDDLAPGLWCGVAGPHHPPSTNLVAQTAHLWTVDQLLADTSTAPHDVAIVMTEPGFHSIEPVHVVHVATANAAASHGGVISRPHTIIDLGADSRIAVIETYCSADGRTVTEASTTVRIGARAELDHCRVQRESVSATHIGLTRHIQSTGSRLRTTSITLGGEIGRNAIDVHLDAPDAEATLTGVNLTSGQQRHDTVVTVDHAASHGTSNQRFIGVVDDRGRCSFSGEIIVRPETVDTDAHQTNRNLVLGPNAQADTRPWLRILADDVRCTHGATVGRLDDDALFYLRSRGIPAAVARSMLIEAFVREITDAIPHETLRSHVDELIAASPRSVAAQISDTIGQRS